MRVFRFSAQLTGTGLFTTSLFVLPVLFALIGNHAEAEVSLDADLDERVVYWEPPTGGGGSDASDPSNEGDDPIETGEESATEDPPELMASKSGTPIRRTQSTSTSGRASRGSGGGSGGGQGAVTMRRPGGHDRPSPVRVAAAERTCEPMVAGIEPLGSSTWSVERELVDEYAKLKRARELVGWVDRHKNTQGRFDGVQVGGIACGSPLHLAGIRSGDVVHEINGVEITGLPSALSAWGKLKRADVLHVSLSRGGRRLQVTYQLS